MFASHQMDTAEIDFQTDAQEESLLCYDCNIKFNEESELYSHLLIHVKQPHVQVKRLLIPIKITLKSNKNKNSFEIVHSPQSSSLGSYPGSDVDSPVASPGNRTVDLADIEHKHASEEENLIESSSSKHSTGSNDADGEVEESIEGAQEEDAEFDSVKEEAEHHEDDEEIDHDTEGTGENDEEDDDKDDAEMLVDGDEAKSEKDEENAEIDDEHDDHEKGDEDAVDENEATIEEETPIGVVEGDEDEVSIINDDETEEFVSVPGAEPTPPPDASPEATTEYPKIRIKSGLLKERLTITEILDDKPISDQKVKTSVPKDYLHSGDWTTPLDDPLRLTDPLAIDKDDGKLISSLFSNHNDRAKDLGFTTSENEFISMDRLDERNRNALQVYSSANSMPQNPLDSLGLPMQQLAQQVSRLQPSNGMHQQNVLINIQQFPQPPPQPSHHAYQAPMFPHPQAIYQPYQYQPPTSLYPYPPAPGYPPHMHPPPPRPQMPTQGMPGMQQAPPQVYRQAMQQPRSSLGPRPMVPPGVRPMMAQRQSLPARPPTAPVRHRAPMQRPMGIRGPRPKMLNSMNPQNNQMVQNSQGQKVIMKRASDQLQNIAAKRKRMDLLMPDKNDDADCQVIAMQPKNTGLPQIQSVQGNAPEPVDNNGVMHLSDSITLSVRNPPPKPASPKKSDAKAVANILATRGITVTAAPKPKEKQQPQKSSSPPVPVAINLNSAVSIIPSKTGAKAGNDTKMQTVDLTDDGQPDDLPTQAPQRPTVVNKAVQPKTNRGLPFRCDLCPAQYPNSLGLSKHRQSFHKTGGPCEYGIPVIDLKQPGILQKLNSIGISNYIPVSGSNDVSLCLPVVSANALKSTNLGAIGATSILSLGPIRTFPRPQNAPNRQH